MVSVSSTWQLGHVGKGADVVAETRESESAQGAQSSDLRGFHIGDDVSFIMTTSKNGLNCFVTPSNWASGKILLLKSKFSSTLTSTAPI